MLNSLSSSTPYVALISYAYLTCLCGFDRWHGHHEDKFYSERVKIVFSAIYTTTNQLGARASLAQGRDVTKHLAEIVSPIYCRIILPCIIFSTHNLTLMTVAGFVEVYDGRGRMAE